MNKLLEEIAVLAKKTFIRLDHGEFAGLREPSRGELIYLKLMIEDYLNNTKE